MSLCVFKDTFALIGNGNGDGDGRNGNGDRGTGDAGRRTDADRMQDGCRQAGATGKRQKNGKENWTSIPHPSIFFSLSAAGPQPQHPI